MLFFADVLGLYDVHGGSSDAAVRWAVEAPANDPMMLIPALVAQTERLAFGVTASTTYEHPFALARRFSTLDHLSNGRIGWNIVTSYLTSAARNFGLDRMIGHDERYARAEEFLDVAYKQGRELGGRRGRRRQARAALRARRPCGRSRTKARIIACMARTSAHRRRSARRC